LHAVPVPLSYRSATQGHTEQFFFPDKAQIALRGIYTLQHEKFSSYATFPNKSLGHCRPR
jgi:hypothetical protein